MKYSISKISRKFLMLFPKTKGKRKQRMLSDTITVSSDSEAVVLNNPTYAVVPEDKTSHQQQGEGVGVEEKPAEEKKSRWSEKYSHADHYWKQNTDYLQLSHMTSEERFPKIFDSAKTLKPDAKRILSFGCSTGEEVQALAKRFPDAEIVGVDIDYSSVNLARKRNKLPNVHFHTDLGATGKYDLVLSLMVFFCIEKPIPQDRWEKMLRKLDPYINPQGVLMIYTSDYDPKLVLGDAYTDLNVWVREHNKNNKQYFNGYYQKKGDLPLNPPSILKADAEPVVSDAVAYSADALTAG